jgi:hypothetical protein
MKLVLTLFSLFFATTSAVRLDCSFSHFLVIWFHENGTHIPFDHIYTCMTTNVELTGGTEMTGFTGQHLAGFTDSDVLGVHFMDACGHLTFIPQGMDRFFPNIIGQFYYFCPIASLQENELDSYRNLKYFEVSWGRISHVPGQLFQHTRNLQYLSLWANRISSVGTGLLDSLYNLSTAAFLDNVCTNSAVFGDRSQIRYLIEELRLQCSRRDILTELLSIIEN